MNVRVGDMFVAPEDKSNVRTGQLRRWASNGTLFLVTGVYRNREWSPVAWTHLCTRDVWYGSRYAGQWEGPTETWYACEDVARDSVLVQEALNAQEQG